jgi:hypothetical protein
MAVLLFAIAGLPSCPDYKYKANTFKKQALFSFFFDKKSAAC